VSKAELEKLILGKKVFLKVNRKDVYYRLIAEVYTPSGNVGQKLLEKGMATFANKGWYKSKEYLKASDKAQVKKIGVYSDKCTQTENPKNPKCNIKGNRRGEESIYHYPGCGQYNNTIVQLYLGDQWFCTEKEAQKAGFTKGSDCK
jgi:micrococcal nuclease